MNGVTLLVLVTLFAPQITKASEADRWFQEALRHFERQEWEPSRSMAEKALQLDPKLGDAEVLLGLIASAQSRPHEAEQHLKRGVVLQPTNPQAHAYLAGVYLEQKRLPEAEAGFQRVLKLSPGNSSALYNLGLIGLLRNEPDKALVYFDQFLKNKPRDIPARMGRLESQLILKQSSEVRQSVDQLTELLSPSDPQLFQAATLLALHGEFGSAISILERIRKNSPDSFDVNYNLALAYFRTDDNRRAGDVLRSCPSLPNRPDGLNLLGQIESKNNRQPEAIEAFRQAAALEPQNEQFQFDYGNQLLQNGLTENAVQFFSQANRNFASSWKMHVGLGAGEYLLGRYDLAGKSLLQAARLGPDSPLCFFLLGKIHALVPALQAEIERSFHVYLAKPRRDAWAYFHLGTILFLKAESQRPPDFESAVQNLRKALGLSPEFPEANLQLGIVLQAQGKMSEATELLEKAASISPNLSAAHYRLALAYQRQGRKQDAQREFDIYERLKTQSKKEDEGRSVLEMLQP